MYKKGDLKLTEPECAAVANDNECYHDHVVSDARGKAPIPHPCAFLPHSCGEWAIGGAEQIKAMIEDLTEVLRIIEGERGNESD